MTDTALPRHEHAIAVAPSDIDFMGHVNNANYLNWVQEAVLAHWQKIAPQKDVGDSLWIALKHEITYRNPAFEDDKLVASVIVEKVQGASAFYDTIITRDDDVLATVKSRWCCIDAETKRPKYIGEDVAALFLPGRK